jgi:hypothetical protein
MKNEIILYQPDALTQRIEVKFEDETVWLSQEQMALLFKQSKQNVSLHIRNCFKENELEEASTVKEYLTVQTEGKRKIKRKINFYNLDVIISVGYRIKSKQGTRFRIWANQVLKDYLLKGYAVNNRMNRLEDQFETLKDKVQQIDLQIHSKLIPTQGIFFEGQVFDAYELTSRIIRSAKKGIILIDNYIDESTLLHLTKKDKHVAVTLLSKSKSSQLDLDLKKANEQYGNFEWREFNKSHDRFLIIDQNEVYHLGASLKDIGKKWFAFSKLDKLSMESMLNSILEVIKDAKA